MMKRARLMVSAYGGELTVLDVEWEGDPRGTPAERRGFANRVAHELAELARSDGHLHQKVEAACDKLWERKMERRRQRPWRVAAVLLFLAWAATFGWMLS